MMFPIRAALAAAVLCVCASAPAIAADPVSLQPVSLDDAFRRVIETHPELESYRFAEVARRAEADLARQAPPLRLAVDAENLLGTGGASSFQSAELTLSLASVIERGDKRDARFAVADERLQGVALLREAKRLDLLGEVARRYLDAAAATALAALTRDDLAQREQLVAAATERRKAGIEQSSAPLAAEAARLRVAAELARTLSAATHARRRLAVLWGGTEADFELAPSDLGALPTLPDYETLVRLLADTPELQQFAHEARLQLARTARVADIDWQLGVRRLQAGSDWGLVGSVSIPFGRASRAEPGIRAAEAELSAIEFEREGQRRALQATLAEAWGQLDLAIGHARRIETEVLPALQRAAEAAERSYRAGASSHLEWTQLQGDMIEARRERLDAALTAHRALIELQRLTGQTFAVAADTDNGTTP